MNRIITDPLIGGAYWAYSQTSSCHIECPKCGIRNYICTHPEKGRLITLIDLHSFSKNNLFQEVEKEKGERKENKPSANGGFFNY